ncbi:hypothetical protein [Acinetobacter baumannii]|uniref:Uncharacterized protein n=1 Tax=Acinetobacter baumannii TaxID=470 RepID=A0A241ZHE0_ACIBA|nr:hypothetical protein [Acinetobacter baumannii]OTM90955.1 hypothetical protein B9X95_05940 [Acinetobacter baumannii]
MSEFKVGDKVLVCDQFFGDSIYTIREIKHKEGFVSIAQFVESGFFRLSGIRHATPQEIAVGRRIDKPSNSRELEILDKPENHISPNCKVEDV